MCHPPDRHSFRVLKRFGFRDITQPMEGDNKVCVTDQALDICPYDPAHLHERTTERIFACKYNITPDSACTNEALTTGTARRLADFYWSCVLVVMCVA